MSNLARGALVLLTAVMVGTQTYVGASDLDRDGALGTLMFSPAAGLALFLVLPVLAIALVNRWWALSLALVPLAVEFYLHEATDYVYPFHEDPYPALVIFSTGILLVIYSLGFLLRFAFDWAVPAGPARGGRDEFS